MRLDKLEIRWLKLFCKIVENKGITNAQDATGLSQPVLSHYLSRLEDTLGLILCERGRGGFSLTTEGELVYQEARSVIATLDDFANRLARIKHELIGEVRLGCLDNIVSHPEQAVPLAIRRLLELSPDASMNLYVSDHQSLMERLRNGELDVVLTVLPDDVLPDIFFQPAFIEHSSFYAAAEHAERIEQEWRDGTLNPKRLLVGGYAMNDICKQLGAVAKQGQQNIACSEEGCMLLILAGTHVGFLPDHYASRWVQEGVLTAIAPENLQLNSIFYLVRNARQRLSPVAEVLWNNIAEIGRLSPAYRRRRQ
ncbi:MULTISPECIES: LysR family transcriptional regulator [Dickeya]|uniref:Transcriptional regulator, LysR family n=1 Tax=Dickeya zeae (strain Ech586) TaxID=590409 RepID=D2C1J5_DICZ5|nr:MULTISPECIES: LysR family transcriptional regulator [Dickeya]ACZ77139.1 transcriptional regulator, LysR family [Dickeya parazeae Ech586]MBP2837689.1 LysR family transcriptional regulator [Dickeya parazeae]UCZ77589.1 LysR family transcriptional regulator [Dickeya zeae]